MDTNKKTRFVAALYGMSFGGFTAFVIWSEWANRLFARPLDILCTPARLLYGIFFGDDDAHLNVYFILCIVYMACLGYLLGYFLYKALSKRRRERGQAQRLSP
jgi:uncharacterized membrane protein